jgi:outer membrane protein assembly factor BamD (BamD/ComL family)
MKELDKVNPRILRYLGYAAYENGNIDGAISSLNEFISVPSTKLLLKIILLGQAKIKKATSADGTTIEPTLYKEGISFIKKKQ